MQVKLESLPDLLAEVGIYPDITLHVIIPLLAAYCDNPTCMKLLAEVEVEREDIRYEARGGSVRDMRCYECSYLRYLSERREMYGVCNICFEISGKEFWGSTLDAWEVEETTIVVDVKRKGVERKETKRGRSKIVIDGIHKVLGKNHLNCRNAEGLCLNALIKHFVGGQDCKRGR